MNGTTFATATVTTSGTGTLIGLGYEMEEAGGILASSAMTYTKTLAVHQALILAIFTMEYGFNY